MREAPLKVELMEDLHKGFAKPHSFAGVVAGQINEERNAQQGEG